ncbi:acetoacetate decarboxylase family protein [Spongiibacter sp. KMU-158]|uniref:Acetoacetate decarboxylase family protein n=1 Tax=Spongiibacter pelagi TaxID=2760804 RepID=A0A927C0G9_9GAMM|nr:acetoacetate decarboxylase family protein [Spongiibacter pelagi]MBD2858988.1 acetoacetate decarboxylase family protein [Spongiibacter pelagi]
MQTLDVIFEEHDVPSQHGPQNTDQCCQKVSAEHFVIDGQDISLPVRIDEASMMMHFYTVKTAVVRRILADTGFTPVELFPGRALMQLIGVDYRRNDLGDYNEAAILFPVTTPGQAPVRVPLLGALSRMASGKLDNFVYRMPVDQPFTTHAGRFIWGFPKWVSKVDFELDDKRVRTRFEDDGELIFDINAAANGRRKMPEQEAPSLTVRHGRASRIVGSTWGEGFTFKLGGKKPEIGNSHPLAKLLRELGLPKRPLCTLSVRDGKMKFPGAEEVAIGQAFSAEQQAG